MFDFEVALSEMEREFDELDRILAAEKSCSKYQFLKRRRYRIEYKKKATITIEKWKLLWKLFEHETKKWPK